MTVKAKVGPLGIVSPSTTVAYPERRPWEVPIIIDVHHVQGAQGGIARGFFRAGLGLGFGEREVDFHLGTPKVANFRPSLCRYRLEVPVNPAQTEKLTAAEAGIAADIAAGEDIPGSTPNRKALNAIRIYTGLVVVYGRPMVIQIHDGKAPLQETQPEPDGGTS